MESLTVYGKGITIIHSRCSMPRTWWLPVVLAMVGTWPLPPSPVAACLWRRLTNRFWTSRTRTDLTLLSGSATMSRLLFVTFLPVAWRWPPPSLVTLMPSRSCSRESLSSSLLCSEERYVKFSLKILNFFLWKLICIIKDFCYVL